MENIYLIEDCSKTLIKFHCIDCNEFIEYDEYCPNCGLFFDNFTPIYFVNFVIFDKIQNFSLIAKNSILNLVMGMNANDFYLLCKHYSFKLMNSFFHKYFIKSKF